jgi:hypothetical protein
MKSLHHVPVDKMDMALQEAERVLVPGGAVYVSEPVAEGRFQDIIRNFHDETYVRQQAQRALRRCRVLEHRHEIDFLAPCSYRSFADFEQRMMRSSTVTAEINDVVRTATRKSYERYASEGGSFFENRPFHVTVLRKPA